MISRARGGRAALFAPPSPLPHPLPCTRTHVSRAKGDGCEFKQLEELMGALKLDEKRKLRERLTEMIEVEELRDLISKP